jgi:hypothetical protein
MAMNPAPITPLREKRRTEREGEMCHGAPKRVSCITVLGIAWSVFKGGPVGIFEFLIESLLICKLLLGMESQSHTFHPSKHPKEK